MNAKCITEVMAQLERFDYHDVSYDSNVGFIFTPFYGSPRNVYLAYLKELNEFRVMCRTNDVTGQSHIINLLSRRSDKLNTILQQYDRSVKLK